MASVGRTEARATPALQQARGRLNMQPPGLGLEVYAGFRPGQSQAFLARFRTWMDTHTDQVIIVGSLLLGFWLIAKSIYLIIT